MLVAGKDTTSFTLCGLLYQLAAHPEHQRRLRDEVTTWMAANPNPSPTDYDNDLPYLNACLKEALRLHGNGHVLIRTCTQDDVLPLLEPIRLVNGHLTTGIPIKKGQNIYCSAIQYHKCVHFFIERKFLIMVAQIEELMGRRCGGMESRPFLEGPRPTCQSRHIRKFVSNESF